MSVYERGLSVAALREQFLRDADQLDEAEMWLRYGRDGPRLLNTDDTMRPSSRHLRSPMYRDQHGREYTPDGADDQQRTTVWWIRLPAYLTARHRAEVAQGKRSPLEVLAFPEPDEELTLEHLRDRQATQLRVRLSDISQRKTASAQVVFDTAVPVYWSQAAEQQLKRNVEFAARRRKRQANEQNIGTH